jgi:hypothetical protein
MAPEATNRIGADAAIAVEEIARLGGGAMRTAMLRHLGGFATPGTAAGAANAARLSLHLEAGGTIYRPPEFSWHDYAVFLLSMAAEIEHSLMVQYLYAAWSLGGPGISPANQPDVLKWQRIILGIAKEEMGHLITVQNVLRLLGGPVHLDREDFPWISGFYPFAFSLEPASAQSVAKYVVAESPPDWPASVSAAEKDRIEQLALADAGMQVRRVGDLYRTMIRIMNNPDWLPDRLFHAETYPFQAAWDEWGRGYAAGARGSTADTAPDVLVSRAANRTQAVQALTAIAQQGEAPQFIPADAEDSHFSRFLIVYRGLVAASGWSASVPLPVDPKVPGIGAPAKGTPITNPESAAWGALFNLRYRMLLTWLAHAFQLADARDAPGPPSRRGHVLNRTFGEMYNLRTIAGLLGRRPLGNNPAAPAGPPFEMPYTLSFPPLEPDFWRLHLDLLGAAKDLVAGLVGRTQGDGLDYARALDKAD